MKGEKDGFDVPFLLKYIPLVKGKIGERKAKFTSYPAGMKL